MTQDDRLIDSVRAVVRSLFPNYTYLGFYRYVLDNYSEADQTFDGKPVDTSKGLPNITKVPARAPGIATIKLADGETVLIGFEDADPTRPFLAHFGYPTGSALPVARQGDMVSTGVMFVELAALMNAASALCIPGSATDGGKAAFLALGQALANCVALQYSTPPPPPYVAGVGGPATLTGVTSSGSTRNKSL
jgi:hypothetical protein